MSDKARMEEIRENWRIDDLEWKDIREEGDKDILCLTGGLWDAMDPDGAKQRRNAKRPIIALDELNQYCNQVTNDFRANKRGIKVTPRGNGANDKSALYLQGRIRDIEYRSNAHQAYATLAENMVQRSYGFARIKAAYVQPTVGDQPDAGAFTQELLIEPIVNPNTCTPDAYSVRSDGKDLRRFWVRESRSVDEFKREFPHADIKNFTDEHRKVASQWLKGNTIDIAECWEKHYAKSRTLLALKPTGRNAAPTFIWKDQAGEIKSDRVLKSREVDQFTVTKVLTNGLEILEELDWPTQALPFVCAYGKVVYITEGGQTKRKMLSLVRLARDPAMLMAYVSSCEAEMVGSITKFPYFYWDGTLTPAAIDKLTRSTHEPVGPIPVKQTTGAGQPTPGFPQRNQLDLELQQLELLKESVRRSIQAAIGASPLPTQAQRQNEKSGIALKKIEDTAQKGSFHFDDHYDEAITRIGELLKDLIPAFDDTAREVSIRKPDDSVAVVRINDPNHHPHIQANQDAGFDPHIPVGQGDHDVTLSVGPRAESERDAQNDFITNLVQSNVPQLVGPQKGPKIIAQGIRALSLGPMVDAIADIIDPKDQGDPAQAVHAAQALQQENQQLKGAVQQLQLEQHAKMLDLQSKEKIAAAEIASKERIAAADRETKITVAELGAKVDRLELFLQERERIGLQGVDAARTAADHAHDVRMALVDHTIATQQADQQHQNALEQGQQATAGAMVQQQQAADLAPPPQAAGA